MQIFVKSWAGTTVVPGLSTLDQIGSLKRRLGLLGKGRFSTRVVFDGRVLADGLTFKDYDIMEGAVLHVGRELRGGGRGDRPRGVKTKVKKRPTAERPSDRLEVLPTKPYLFILMDVGNVVKLTYNPSATIGLVKAMVEEDQGIPAAWQRLLYCGEEVDDHQVLREYGILAGDGLEMTLRPAA